MIQLPARTFAPLSVAGLQSGKPAQSKAMPISRSLAAMLPTVLGLLIAAPAGASSDNCEPSWSLDFTTYSECVNVAALVPGNDTRATLLLLLTDRSETASPEASFEPLLGWRDFRTTFFGPTAPGSGAYADGEGSRCRSDLAGTASFTADVQAAEGLSEAERKSLIDARANLKPSCEGGQQNATGSSAVVPSETALTASLQDVTSAKGRAFATYLRAANAFYAGRFDEADAAFESLRSDPDPWIADTSAYMVARTAVNRSQLGVFDEYGTFKGGSAVDRKGTQRASEKLQLYLAEHPHGLYVTSARGLQRRVAWLAGQTEELATRYATLFGQSPTERGVDSAALAEEVDNKLLPSLTLDMTRDPILLATLDLKAMRGARQGEKQSPPPDLATQRDAFATEPALYEYLLAVAAFYDDHDPKFVIQTIPDDTRRRGGNNLWFSRQFLRGLALDAVKDRNARGFWKELVPGATRPLEHLAAELALAFHDERRGDIEDAFQPTSPLSNPALRAILLSHDAGPGLLRARMNDSVAREPERRVAFFTLLRKELTGGAYREFLADAAHVPADAPATGSVDIDPLDHDKLPLGVFVRGATKGDIGCPVLADTVAGLARSPNGVRDKLCLAEWLRLNGFDTEQNDTRLTRGDLGSGPSTYPGTPITRSAIYQDVIAEKSASANDRAFALYRAVKCYEPTGYNGCGRPDAPKSERHRWYDVLKRDHPGSRWARQLPYWW